MKQFGHDARVIFGELLPQFMNIHDFFRMINKIFDATQFNQLVLVTIGSDEQLEDVVRVDAAREI